MSSPELNELPPGGENFEPVLSLKEKLSRVAAHCAFVPKTGENTFHHYSYATAADVFQRVNEALIENRLISVPTFRVFSMVDTLVMVECSLEVEDIDSPALAKVVAFGSGMDKGDKAVMKAQTAALKYAWAMLLNISWGDDPEADATTDARASGEPVRARQTPEQYQEKVKRNATAPLSPLGQKLADETEADLSPALRESLKKVREAKGLWPHPGVPGLDVAVPLQELPPIESYEPEPGDTESGPICDCGSPLITKMVKGQPKYFCELADLASNYEWAVGKAKNPKPGAREAYMRVQEMDKTGEFPADSHTKFKPKV